MSTNKVEPLLCLALAVAIHGTDKAVQATAVRAGKRYRQEWLHTVAIARRPVDYVRRILGELDE